MSRTGLKYVGVGWGIIALVGAFFGGAEYAHQHLGEETRNAIFIIGSVLILAAYVTWAFYKLGTEAEREQEERK